MHAENSDVLLVGSVAVAVMTLSAPTDTGSVALKLATQLLFVVTVTEPMNV
jgi:hypothetical protein